MLNNIHHHTLNHPLKSQWNPLTDTILAEGLKTTVLCEIYNEERYFSTENTHTRKYLGEDVVRYNFFTISMYLAIKLCILQKTIATKTLQARTASIKTQCSSTLFVYLRLP